MIAPCTARLLGWNGRNLLVYHAVLAKPMPFAMTNHSLPADLLIEARWIIPVDRNETLHNHAVVIQQGRIEALLPAAEARSRYHAREHLKLDEHILIPGLINLHTHAAMTLMRGMADDLPLMTWLQEHIWPAEGKHMSSEFVLDGTRLACAEMLKGGITCFNDMYFYPDAAAQAAAEFGMRAVLGITTLEFPTPYANDAEDYISKGIVTLNQWQSQPLTHFCLAPHAPYTVSDRSFIRLKTLADQLNLPIHCHIHETRDEVSESMQQHGERPLARLHRLGLLGPGFIGVHAVHLDDDEIELLAETGSHIAHCPTSNLKLASGIARIESMRQKGINIGLGSDGAASNNRLDIFAEMRLAALLAKGHSGNASALPCLEALRMATINAAQALGIGHETGSISVGKSADLCALAVNELSHLPVYDPVSHLVNVLGREAVSHVWVGGKCCVDNKTLTNQHLNRLEAKLALWQNRLEFRPHA